jgi:hypothetical protein
MLREMCPRLIRGLKMLWIMQQTASTAPAAGVRVRVLTWVESEMINVVDEAEKRVNVKNERRVG